MRSPSMTITALIAAGLVATSCGGPAARSGQGRSTHYAKDGVFTMAISAAPASFNPYGGLGAHGLGPLAYDSLVNQLPDGRFVSGLAQKWNADAKSATFVLRPEVTCSDGTPLTATHVADAITYVSDPKHPSGQLGVNIPQEPLKATADDATRTVTVAMTKAPYGFLLNTIGRLPIVCPRGLSHPESLNTGSSGTGPYTLTKVVPGQSYTFTVRKDYRWGPGGASTAVPGTPGTVVVKIIETEATAANLLLSGQINLAKVTGPDSKRLESRGMKRLDWQTTGAWLSFNQIGGRPTADPRVRKALVSALNLSEIVKVSTGGTRQASTGLLTIAPTACAANTVAGQLPGYDVTAAERLLDEAGWVRGPGGLRTRNGRTLSLSLEYVPTNSAYDAATAELLAQQWKKIGIDVKLSGDPFAKLNEVLFKTSNWEVYLGGWFFSLPSQLVGYLSGPVPPGGDNISGIKNERYDRLVAQAKTLTAPAACRYWNDAERAIIGDLDLVPVSNRSEYWFLNKADAAMQRYNGPIPTSLRLFG